MLARMWTKSERTAMKFKDGSVQCQLCHRSCYLSDKNPLGRCNMRRYQDALRQSVEGAMCRLCSHFCILSEDYLMGKCGVRYFRDGQIFTLVDNVAAACNIDPIEKKPLYHFKPQSKALSIGTVGCNFSCSWCQNHSLVTAAFTASDIASYCDDLSARDFESLKPSFGKVYHLEFFIELVKAKQIENIAYTYNEPTIFFEQFSAIAQRAQEENINNILVTNGYFSKDVFAEFSPYIQALNIDIKAFSEETYNNYCGARLKPVLDNCVRVREAGLYLEVTTLIIPDLNDSTEELAGLAKFIAENLGKETVWHISAFHPCHEMCSKPVTPLSTLDRAYQIGKDAGLEYIYYGNVPKNNDTVCPHCGKILIKRQGYTVEVLPDFKGKCPSCDYLVHGVW